MSYHQRNLLARQALSCNHIFLLCFFWGGGFIQSYHFDDWYGKMMIQEVSFT